MAYSHPITKNSRQISHPVNHLQKPPQFEVWWKFEIIHQVTKFHY
jgi:hypothetical protein